MRASVLGLLILTMVIAGLDVANGSTRLPGLRRDSVVTSTNIAGSPLWNMFNRLKASSQAVSGGSRPWTPPPASYAALLDWTQNHPDGSVLVVLVESMGLPLAADVREAMLAPLRSELPAELWSIESTSERFSGSTTHGELRVLCGMDGRYQSFRDSAADTSTCLPARWAARGATTAGLHGFTGQMFDRQLWWPQVGLKDRLFAEQLARDDNLCGEAFQGVCDGALLREAVRRLSPGPSFAYALTLNTHLPLRDRPVDPAFQQQCSRMQVPHLPCILISKQAELLRVLGEALRTSSVRPLVVISGDHAPPFGDVRDRAVFSPNSVPVLLLRPKP